jgi:hypothetical protein
MMKWIAADEQQPPIGMQVLVWTGKVYLFATKKRAGDDGLPHCVTHWMFLPDPPRKTE